MPSKIRIGNKAPNFTLPDTEGKLQSLSNFKNKNVVLAFFVSCFTTTCTKEMCTFRDSIGHLIGLSAQIIGISVNDLNDNRNFAVKNRLPFPILSDIKGQVIKKYGIEKTNFGKLDCSIAKRSIFIIDKNGIIQYIWTTNDATAEPDYEGIIELLSTIK